MNIIEKIDLDFKTALKARDELKTAVLRMIKAAIKNKEIDLRRPLNEEEVMGVLKSQAKQRRDSIAQFTAGNRPDLADREQAELAVVESYLPQAMSAEEVEAAVKAVIQETGAASAKELGKVMKAFQAKFAGRADGKVVNETVRRLLS